MKLGLKGKFIFPTLVLIVLGMGILTVASYLVTGDTLRNILSAEIGQLADMTDDRVGSSIENYKVDVVSWSEQKLFQSAVQDSFVGKAARSAANELLTKLRHSYGQFAYICVANASGEIIAASDESLIGQLKVKDREYFVKSLGGDVFVSDIFPSKKDGDMPVFAISAPVREKDQITGVLFGILDVHEFVNPLIGRVKVGESGFAYIFAKDGTVIAHPDKSAIMKLKMDNLDFGREMLSKEGGLIYHKVADGERWESFRKNRATGWTISIVAIRNEILGPVQRLGYINLGVMLLVILAAAGLTWLIAAATVKPIKKLLLGLDEGSNHVANASEQISRASRQLAEGASDQAASIEETSSSLEELSSMTKLNSEHSMSANHMMAETSEVASQANHSMDALTASMREISTASRETSKIIRTIDEIAFQTNLLALNAAVEAARAGEAGAGFAVVADEVRNLAMRAAEAAKNTAGLIESTVGKINGGEEIVGRTSTEFSRVTERMDKMGDLIGEIAHASGEQAQGIEQINRAVAAVDKVVQQNAATAEESASASQEMHAQAERMKGYVKDLVAIMEGRVTAETRNTKSGKDRTGWWKVAVAMLHLGSARSRKATGAHREYPPGNLVPSALEFSGHPEWKTAHSAGKLPGRVKLPPGASR